MAAFELDEVNTFNQAIHKVRLVSVPGSGGIYYIGRLDPHPENLKRLQARDVMHFNLQGGAFTKVAWRAVVLPKQPWTHSGQVAFRLSRPRVEATLGEEHLHGPRPFVQDKVAVGTGDLDSLESIQVAFKKAPAYNVQARLECSDLPVKRIINAFNLLLKGAKQASATRAGKALPWVRNEHLVNLQSRILNKTAIPESYFDMLGDAAEELINALPCPDHQRCLKYLTQIPVIHNLAIGILTGRAGTGKTYFLAKVIAALLAADAKLPVAQQTKKILFVAPSNVPTDVGIDKICQVCQEYPELEGELIARGYNVASEKAYVYAYTKREGEKVAKQTPVAQPSPNSNAPRAQPIATTPTLSMNEIIDRIKMTLDRNIVAQVLRFHSLPVKEFSPRIGLVKWVYEMMTAADASSEEFNLVHQYIEALKKAIVAPTTVPIISDAELLPDGLVDADVADTETARSLIDIINQSLKPGEALVDDPRFKQVRQSIGFTILATAGAIPFPNKYTDVTKFATLRTLINRSIAGEDFDEDGRLALAKNITAMREYIATHAKVLGSTPINACTVPFYSKFKPTLIVADEINRGLIAELTAVLVHYEAPTILIVGDEKQLDPVVTGPPVLSGFLPEITMSALTYFKSTHIPSAEIRLQRRSRAGIMDAPTYRYYGDWAFDGSLANSDGEHPITWPFIDVLDALIPAEKGVPRSATAYLVVSGSVTKQDSATSSYFNVTFASIIVNIIESAVSSGISAKAFGIITPYRSQIAIYRHAFLQLHVEYPKVGYDLVNIGTTDSMEGNEAPVVFFDSGVTGRLDFTNDRGRCLVNTTRATDASVVVLQPAFLDRNRAREEIELVELHKLASQAGVTQELGKSNELYTHRYIAQSYV